MKRGDIVKFKVDKFFVSTTVEDEGLVLLRAKHIDAEAISSNITMQTRFKLPLDYISDFLGYDDHGNVIDLSSQRFRVCIVEQNSILIQDIEYNYYLKARESHLAYSN